MVSMFDWEWCRCEGKRLFDELDRDNDGQVTLEDLEVAMKKRRFLNGMRRSF